MRASVDRSQPFKAGRFGEEGMQEADSSGFRRMGFLPGGEPWDFPKGIGANESRADEAVQEAVSREDQLQRFELLRRKLPLGDAVRNLPEAALLVRSFSCLVE